MNKNLTKWQHDYNRLSCKQLTEAFERDILFVGDTESESCLARLHWNVWYVLKLEKTSPTHVVQERKYIIPI